MKDQINKTVVTIALCVGVVVVFLMRSPGPFLEALAMFVLWAAYAVLALLLAAPVVFLGRKRVQWRIWELSAVVIPFCVWFAVGRAPCFSRPKEIGNIFEPAFISVAVPIAAILRVAVGRRVREDVLARSLILSLCLVAFGVHWFTPPLFPERPLSELYGQPTTVIRTDDQAMQTALLSLQRGHVPTNQYDMSKTVDSYASILKGTKTWRFVWAAKDQPKDGGLVVLTVFVNECGWVQYFTNLWDRTSKTHE